jgi:hypothetical protein
MEYALLWVHMAKNCNCSATCNESPVSDFKICAHEVFRLLKNGSRMSAFTKNSLAYGAEPFLRRCHCAATQKISSILWHPKVHYRVQESPPLVPILSQIHTIPSYLSEIHFNIVHPPTSWSS